MDASALVWIVVAAVAVALLVLSVRVVQQYEMGVQFRLGKLHGVRKPGLRRAGRRSA